MVEKLKYVDPGGIGSDRGSDRGEDEFKDQPRLINFSCIFGPAVCRYLQ